MQKRLFPRIAAAASALLLLAACGQSRPEGPAEVLLHTTAGDIRIELDGRTPLHRDNFLKLTREGFFDSVLFHRVIADFMIQAGDPASRRAPAGTMLGESDAGYLIPAEIVYPALAHTRGALAAARTSDEVNPERKSSGSQFYIVWGKPFDGATLDRIQQSVTAATNGEIVIPDSLRTIYETTGGTPFLDGQYTVFGRVTEGLEIVKAIQGVATDSAGRWRTCGSSGPKRFENRLNMKKTTGKIAVMGASFALFLCGAGALQLERGTAQTVILAVVFAGLLTIAGVQTFRRMKNKE